MIFCRGVGHQHVARQFLNHDQSKQQFQGILERYQWGPRTDTTFYAAHQVEHSRRLIMFGINRIKKVFIFCQKPLRRLTLNQYLAKSAHRNEWELQCCSSECEMPQYTHSIRVTGERNGWRTRTKTKQYIAITAKVFRPDFWQLEAPGCIFTHITEAIH